MVRVSRRTRIMLLQYRRSSAVKPGRRVLVFGWTRNPYRNGAEQEVLSTMGGCLGYFVWLEYRPRGVDASAHFGRRRARRPAAMQSRNF